MGVTALLCLALWATVVPLAFGWSSVAILSGSMAPGIEAGDVVLTTHHDGVGLSRGAVIVFADPAGQGKITHRIVGVTPSGDYVTRGDSNGRIDSDPVAPDQVFGVGRVLVPFVGKPYVWAHSGQWLKLALMGSAIAIALWASRWAVQDRFDPWPNSAPLHALSSVVNIRLGHGHLVGVVTVIVLVANVTGVDSRAAFVDNTDDDANFFAADVLAPPTGPTAVCGPTITLDWTATVDTYATGHRVFRATTPGGPYSQIAEITPRATVTYDDTPAAGVYYYVVRAYYLSWESTDSTEVFASTGTCGSFGSIADSFFKQDKPTETAGSAGDMTVASRATAKNMRSVVSFDVSSIPAGATIDAATLTLCLKEVSPGRTYDLHRATSSWDEATVNWSNQPTVVAGVTDSTVSPAMLGCMTWTVTADIQLWVDGTANDGWRLNDSVEDEGDNRTKFFTKEKGSDEPQLDVAWTP
jgi:signal peptidase